MKFLILCFPRTGSTSLITAIAQHPGIRQGMELFNPVLEGDADYVAWRKHAVREMTGGEAAPLTETGYLDFNRLDAVELVRRFYRDFDGTKIMYDQLPSNSPAWHALSAMQDLRLIILYRNPIAAAVSFKYALESGVWHVPITGDSSKPEPISFDPGYFAWFHDHFCSGAEAARVHFIRHPILDIAYEDMLHGWHQVMTLVDDYLGLTRITHAQPFRKGLDLPTHALVANPREVRHACLNHAGLAPHVEFVFGEPAWPTTRG